jgi:hypothetical protein
MATRIFDGKPYRRWAGYKDKKIAMRVAAGNRKGGWNARTIKEGAEWVVYLRKRM